MRFCLRNPFSLTAVTAVFLAAAAVAGAQSTNQDFPTAVTGNEIVCKIDARDIGDARLTTYYFVFEGMQGDLFLNAVAKNFSGDIDVFTQTGLKPLTKMVFYADLGETETGRVVYMRKPERLLLRVQGRSPNDESASIHIKFAGSFSAVESAPEEPPVPKVERADAGSVRVNAVGTILPSPSPSPTPVEPAEIAAAEPPAQKEPEGEREVQREPGVDEPKPANAEKPAVVITEGIPPGKTIPARPARTPQRKPARRPRPRPEKETAAAPAAAEEKPVEPEVKAKPARTRREQIAAALENVKLVILFKDGGRIERPMNEVLRFSVDNGVLTVISKNGSIGRYSILDVTKVSIE
jgi:hypothetical protein